MPSAVNVMLKLSIYKILHIYKQTTEYLSKGASQEVGKPCFPNSQMLKKFLMFAQVELKENNTNSEVIFAVYRLTKDHVTSSLISSLSVHYSAASRATDAQIAAQYVFCS